MQPQAQHKDEENTCEQWPDPGELAYDSAVDPLRRVGASLAFGAADLGVANGTALAKHPRVIIAAERAALVKPVQSVI